jgi:hypothetical protein
LYHQFFIIRKKTRSKVKRTEIMRVPVAGLMEFRMNFWGFDLIETNAAVAERLNG